MLYKELDDGQLLTVDEVAAWLRLEKPYVYRLAREGELPRAQFGRYVRIPAGAVRAYILANLAEAEEPQPVSGRRRPGARRPGARSRRHLRVVHDAEQ
jgi:excisionase family DNA binding protein